MRKVPPGIWIMPSTEGTSVARGSDNAWDMQRLPFAIRAVQEESDY